jgi:hypothetical protein
MSNVCVSSEELLREAMRSIPVSRRGDTIFIPLPSALWVESSGQCICDFCKEDNSRGYWDTMAVAKNPENYERTWLVHFPELHREADRRARAAEDAEVAGG